MTGRPFNYFCDLFCVYVWIPIAVCDGKPNPLVKRAELSVGTLLLTGAALLI